MAYKINFEEYSSNFALPCRIADDALSAANGDYLKVALLIFRNSDKHYSVNLLSNLLNLPEKTVEEAVDYWIQKGILIRQETAPSAQTAVVLQRHQVQPAPAPARSQLSGELSFLLECMENQLGRPVTSVEYKSVVHILEYIKLPADVVLMAIEYCISIEKANARYIEKVCTAWADKGITTHEAAEEYLSYLKQSRKNEDAVKKLFGIQNRNLIDSEKSFIAHWFGEYQFDLDVIKLAYERTITAINKLSFPYINKILASWHEKGYATAGDIQTNEGIGKKTASSANTSYDLDELDRYWDNVPKLD